PDGNWQIGYGRGWNVSKVWDRYKMSGGEFLERVEERRMPLFAQVEHIRWLAALIEKPSESYLPPADRRYASKRAAAVMDISGHMPEAKGTVVGIPFAATPDQRLAIRDFEAPSDAGENYGSRMRGFVYPPRSGDYVFSVAADDEADLFLSTDDDPDNKAFIAHVREWTEPGQFDKFGSQKSKPVRLEGGKRYYIEAVHKENTGGDHLAVAWSGPGVTAGVIRGASLSPYPSGAKGRIVRELWNKGAASTPAAKAATQPEPPIKVAPGVIHVEAEDFFTRGGTSFYGGQHASVPVVDCRTGGKQLCFQANMGDAYVGYKIDVPKTGTYELTARTAVVNWNQTLFARAFGSMPRPKSAKVSAVFHNMVKDLGADKAIDQNPGTRWAVNEGVDKAWLELDMGKPIEISTVLIDERTWNRVSKFQVEYKVGEDWKMIFEGTNIGMGFSKKFPPVTAQHVRLNILNCRGNGGPTLWEFSVGSVPDGRGFINPKWSPDLAGRWQTTKPVEMRLAKGAQTIWLSAGYQRGLALRWFELTPKRK
ncbi:discoidin domain-containing protein, partial [bacterium]|nr:discoidin domain-containing protein [bacterium]